MNKEVISLPIKSKHLVNKIFGFCKISVVLENRSDIQNIEKSSPEHFWTDDESEKIKEYCLNNNLEELLKERNRIELKDKEDRRIGPLDDSILRIIAMKVHLRPYVKL
jgi:hypothetical protein